MSSLCSFISEMKFSRWSWNLSTSKGSVRVRLSTSLASEDKRSPKWWATCPFLPELLRLSSFLEAFSSLRSLLFMLRVGYRIWERLQMLTAALNPQETSKQKRPNFQFFSIDHYHWYVFFSVTQVASWHSVESKRRSCFENAPNPSLSKSNLKV